MARIYSFGSDDSTDSTAGRGCGAGRDERDGRDDKTIRLCRLFVLALLVVFSALTVRSARSEGLSTFPLGSTAPDIVLIDATGKQIALAPYFEKNRILLLFIPDECTADATGYLTHLSSLKNALEERALEVAVVVNEHSSLLKLDFGPHVLIGSHSDYVATIVSSNSDGWPLSILIGKDKSVKLRERQFVPVKALFATIDAMPMRKEELRNKKKSGN